jgi:hypothetical protein
MMTGRGVAGPGDCRPARGRLLFVRGSRLINFLNRESVTIGLIFSAWMLYIVEVAPSPFHNFLLFAALTATAMSFVLAIVNRL